MSRLYLARASASCPIICLDPSVKKVNVVTATVICTSVWDRLKPPGRLDSPTSIERLMRTETRRRSEAAKRSDRFERAEYPGIMEKNTTPRIPRWDDELRAISTHIVSPKRRIDQSTLSIKGTVRSDFIQ